MMGILTPVCVSLLSRVHPRVQGAIMSTLLTAEFLKKLQTWNSMLRPFRGAGSIVFSNRHFQNEHAGLLKAEGRGSI